MLKYEKCVCLIEENQIARCSSTAKCDVGDYLTKKENIFYCSKTRAQYKVTATCWKVRVKEFTLP